MIRKVAPDDRSELIGMMTDFYGSDAVSHEVNPANFARTFDELMKGSPYVECYIFVEGGEIAGYALLALTYANEAGGLAVVIDELYMKPEWRGKGFAHQFFQMVEQEYPQAKRFRLEVMGDNTGAIALYERLGYMPLEYCQFIKDK